MTFYPEVLLSFLSKLYSHKTLRYVVGVFIIVFSLFYASLSVQAADFEFTWKDHNTIDVDNIGDFSARTDKNAVVGSNIPSEYFSHKSFADGACSEMIASIDSEWRMYYPINSTSAGGTCGFDSYATVSFSNDRPAATGDEPDPDEQAKKDKEALKMLEICPNLADAGGVIQIKGLDNKTYAALKKNVLGDNPDCDKALKLLDGSEFPADDQGGTETFEEGTSCAVEGIGWLICPVVNFLGIITDKMYEILADNLLVVRAGEIFDTNGETYKAWSAVRNIANVAFVLAFLLLIYSQITGGGMSNYGIKKMLPKLVVAAVLVNTSFWICAIAVDLSNIVGYSIKEFFDSSATGGFKFTIDDGGVTKTGNGWTDLTVAVLATAGLVYLGLSVLLPALVVVAFALVTVVAVLAVRQALIILLIVIAPLAFVAYLLPNTEDWFKKWMALFKTLLLVFPIIGAVFGASALASTVVMGAAQGSVVVSVVGALISVVPLFITPIIMKSGGGVLNRIGGVINNPNKGPFDRLRKGAEGYRQNRQEYRKLKALGGGSTLPGRGILTRGRLRREAVLNNRKAELQRSTSEYIADKAQASEGFRESLARGGGEGAQIRALAGAVNAKTKLEADEVNAARAVIDHMNLSDAQKALIANGKEVTSADGFKLSGAGAGAVQTRIAARQSVIDSGDADEINNVINGLTEPSVERQERARFAEALGKSSNKPAYVQPMDLNKMQQHDIGGVKLDTAEDMIKQALRDGVYSADKLTTTGKQEAGIVMETAKKMVDGGVQKDVAAVMALQEAATLALTDERLNPRLSKQRPIVESIAGGDPNTWVRP